MKNNTLANDRFIDAYFNMLRLIQHITTDDLRKIANLKIKRFIENRSMRNKFHVPDIGTWLLWFIISNIDWSQAGVCIIEEVFARNVFWYQRNYPSLNQKDKTWVADIFKATQVSRRIVCFQIRFAQIAKIVNPSDLDSNFGRPSDAIRLQLKSIYASVDSHTSFTDYIDFLGIRQPPDIRAVLQNAEADALRKKYIK